MENRDQDSKGRFIAGNRCGGRPKIPAEFRESIRSYSDTALKTIVKIMKDKKASHAVRLRAAEYILNQAFGSPPTMIIEPAERIVDDGFIAALENQVAVVFSGSIDTPEGVEDT